MNKEDTNNESSRLKELEERVKELEQQVDNLYYVLDGKQDNES
jgi:tetrahydromethanopterin S-methyltransferase subunit B